jgi:cytochrome P450
MSSEMSASQTLDRDRLRELFDLRSSYNVTSGGDFTLDPYPIWKRLREQSPVHEGTPHALTGYPGEAMFHGLPFADRKHYTVFTYAECDQIYRDNVAFASSPDGVLGEGVGHQSSLLSMDGQQHRRYRGLVQPSFVPARAQWWIRNWIEQTVHSLIDKFVDQGRAELNVDFCAAIPVLTITGSFGIPVEQALDIRTMMSQPAKVVEFLAPLVAACREQPGEDLLSVLVDAELTDDDGVTHHLSDLEIYSFAVLLLLAGSGTTWKQMGITLATMLQRPEIVAATREDRELLKSTVEESLRWLPTDPAFARFCIADTVVAGTPIEKGAVVHLNLGAANRDPARWENPERFDPYRPKKASLGFGGGAHICLGMHVARAEMNVGIGALLDRLPNLRLDPDAEAPQFIGMYERGATAIPVVFG